MNLTTANSTATGIPDMNISIPTSATSPAPSAPISSPAYTNGKPNFNLSTPAPVITADVTKMYSPQTGPNTQKTADTTYAEKIITEASKSGPIPSDQITSGGSSASVGAKRGTYEALLQDYLDKQNSLQSRLSTASTITPEEQALSKKLIEQKTQAQLDEEKALASGETSSFAGGEAQRVNRTNSIMIAGTAAQLEQLQTLRTNATKTIQDLITSGDQSLKTQLEIRKLQDNVDGIDKQAQTTFFNLAQSNPSVDVTYDPTKTPLDNLTAIRSKIGATQAVAKSYTSDPVVSSLYNIGLITGGTEAERQSRANQIASLPQAQKDLAVQALAFNTLGPTQKTNFESNQRASQLAQNAIGMVTEDMINNPYKYTFNNNVGYIGGKKDLQYTNFIQNVQSVIAPIRLSYFGASLTTGEQESANQFLPDPKKDDAKALVLKLNNVDSIARFTNDTMIANALGTQKPNIDSYIQVEADGTPRPEWVREAYKNGYSKTEIESFKKQKGFSSVGNTSASIQIPQTSRLAYVNNNPGNLRFAGQDGAVQGDGGFAKFPDAQSGFNALQSQIKLDSSRGLTLAQFINKYAPPSENNTSEYLKQATSTLGHTPNTALSKIPVTELAKFIAKKESSTKIS